MCLPSHRPAEWRQNEEPKFHSCRLWWGSPTILPVWCQRRPSKELETSSPSEGNNICPTMRSVVPSWEVCSSTPTKKHGGALFSPSGVRGGWGRTSSPPRGNEATSLYCKVQWKTRVSRNKAFLPLPARAGISEGLVGNQNSHLHPRNEESLPSSGVNSGQVGNLHF